MMMNAMIPLGGNPIDIPGAFREGQERQQQNALREFLMANGNAIMTGDKNALAHLAGFDPTLALDLQSKQHGMGIDDKRLALDTRTAESGVSLDRARIEEARETSRLRAAEHSAAMSKADREKAAEEAKAAYAKLTAARDAGPEVWQRLNDEFPGQEDTPWEEADLAIAEITGIYEGVAGEQFSLSPGETRFGSDGRTIASVPAAPEADPASVQEYQFAQAQGEKRPYSQWLIETKRAGASSVTTNIAGEKSWDTESAKLFAKRYDDMGRGAQQAQEMLGMYDLAEDAINSGVRTGIGADAELTLRQFGAGIGVGDADKLSGGELIRSVQNRMALTMRNPDSGMGMPGAVSDRDIRFLKDSQIGIDRSPEGNRRMLEAFRKLENRKIEIAELADRYVTENGRLDQGFNQMVREFAEANPLFGDAGALPQLQRMRYNPETGEIE